MQARRRGHIRHRASGTQAVVVSGMSARHKLVVPWYDVCLTARDVLSFCHVWWAQPSHCSEELSRALQRSTARATMRPGVPVCYSERRHMRRLDPETRSRAVGTAVVDGKRRKKPASGGRRSVCRRGWGRRGAHVHTQIHTARSAEAAWPLSTIAPPSRAVESCAECRCNGHDWPKMPFSPVTFGKGVGVLTSVLREGVLGPYRPAEHREPRPRPTPHPWAPESRFFRAILAVAAP